MKLQIKACNASLALLFLGGAILSGCSSSTKSAGYGQCVPYARELSGIQIYGNAHQWWYKAGKQNYPRGWRPIPGAVLVLSQTRRLRYGHLAVVKEVLGPRDITVAHANWGKDYLGRGLIYTNMHVKDVSNTNNWTKLRFQSGESAAFGAVYSAKGFIYRKI